MQVIFRPYDSNEPGEVVFQQKIQMSRVSSKQPSRPRDGLNIIKIGRIFDIFFTFKFSPNNKSYGIFSLTEAEVLTLAKLCKRGRSDEEFLKAIAVAGEPPAKRHSR